MRKGPVAISEAVEIVLRGLVSGRASEAGHLSRVWAKAIGADNTRHAKPVDIRGGVLIVHVDSSGWLHKLTMEKMKILSQVKSELGEDVVSDIKLRIGPLLY